MNNFLELTITAAFIAGLAGGVHCAGMCGGIVGTLCAQPAAGGAARLRYLLAYNAGRIASYTTAGMLAGAVGQAGLLTRSAPLLQPAMFAVASMMLVALGLHLSGIPHLVQRLEPAGAYLWRMVQPWTRYVLPTTSLPRALALGAIWGWLPCGLVYAVLLAALALGNWWQGGAVMLAFGLGTLPNLLGLGWFSQRIRNTGAGWRPIAGFIIAGFGIYGVIKALHPVGVAGYGMLCHAMPGLLDILP